MEGDQYRTSVMMVDLKPDFNQWYISQNFAKDGNSLVDGRGERKGNDAGRDVIRANT